MQEYMEDKDIILSVDNVDELNKILLRLNAAIKSARLYPLQHPQVSESISELLTLLQQQIGMLGDITLRFIENQVVFNNTPLYESSGAVSGFVKACLDKHFQSITFSRELNLDEITHFVRIMAMSPEELRDRGGMQEELLSHDVSHIIIKSFGGLRRQEEAGDAAANGNEVWGVRAKGMSEVRKAMENVQLGQDITNVEDIKELVDDILYNLLHKKSALLGLTSIKSYDDYTFCHSVNVGILSLGLGMHLSLPKHVLQGLGVGGILHDIGKIHISESILNKPGKLNDDEWAIMRSHPVNGARILRKTPGVSEHAPVVAFEHHVKYDLSGYPSLIKQRSLSPYSMVVGIADCYDAMTTLRPYQKPRTPSEALEIMLGLSGRDFEPALINGFVYMIGVYPVGSFVRLDTNEFAVVYELNPEDAERPKVKIVIDDKGQHLEQADLADLSERDADMGRYKRSIIQAVNPVSNGINIADFL